MTLLTPFKSLRSIKLAKLPVVVSPVQPDVVSEQTPVVATPSDLLRELGEHLRKCREQRSLSIDDISALTQIQPKLVHAIETGYIEILPEAIYVKGMVKRYGDSLGLDGYGLAHYVPTWQREVLEAQKPTRLQTPFTPVRIKPIYIYVLYILAITIGGAGISHQIEDFIKPPTVLDRVISK